MNDLLKRMKTNALLSAALYALLGLVLLVWPELSTNLLCFTLGLILVLCGLADILVFLRHRDGSLYAALHLITGVILAAVGLWLMARPTQAAGSSSRKPYQEEGCANLSAQSSLSRAHGFGAVGDALTLRKHSSPRWTAALVLGLVTLVLGVVLVICPFQAFTTVVRLLGAFLLYDGLSDLWITGQVGKAVRQTEKAANAEKNAVDVEYRDVKDE